MDDIIKKYSQAAKQIRFAVKQLCLTDSDANLIKGKIRDSYTYWAHLIYNKAFLNWGLWDKKIHQEYSKLDFNFNKICNAQDIYSQLLLYYLISPLVQKNFFNKDILDIGCGNGIGLRVSSEILKTQYALGVDLVNKLATNSNNNFYEPNLRHYIQADAENLPIESDRFDIITNLESSHLYPRIEIFFAEVERILKPGGYFCYADFNHQVKQQAKKLEAFVKTKPNLMIVQKHDITKIVQASIHQRMIVNEDLFYKNVKLLLGENETYLFEELPDIARGTGLAFLPWWQTRFKNPALSQLARRTRKIHPWGKKYYF